MGSVEPLGKKGDEQAYRVTTDYDTVVVFFNEQKMLGNCTECRSGKCEHVDLVQLTYELEVDNFKWINLIAYTLDRYNTTSFRRLWGVITDGMIATGHPLRHAIRTHHRGTLMPLVWKHGLPLMSKENRERVIKEVPELEAAFEKSDELHKRFEEAFLREVNYNLGRMSIYECGYLSLMPIKFDEFGIDEDLIHPNWHKGSDWVFDSGAVWLLMEHDVFITNDEQYEDYKSARA